MTRLFGTNPIPHFMRLSKKDISLIIGFILFAVIMMLSAGCGPSHYLKKSERALRKAEQLGAKVSTDTVWKEIQVPIMEVRTDTVFESLQGDTILIEKERLRIKYVNLPGDSVFIEGACLPDTVKVNVPVAVTKEISAGYSLWEIIIFGIFVGAIAYLVGWWRKKG